MFDYTEVIKALEVLHEAASPLLGDVNSSVATSIYCGDYSLAMDNIAIAYLHNNVPMPPDLFAVFEALAKEMKLEKDPEYSAVAELRQRQAVKADGSNKQE